MAGNVINLLDNYSSQPSGYGDKDTNKVLTNEQLDNQLIKWGISKKMLISTIRSGDQDSISSILADAHLFLVIY